MTETVGLCTAVNLGLVSKGFVAKAYELGIDMSRSRLESGGEDMPDAYLVCPVIPSQLNANIVELPPGTAGERRKFVIVYALLFGFRSSVVNFTRFSVLLQSIGRRVLDLTMTMFYDAS